MFLYFVPSFMGNPLVILLTANQLDACFKTTLKKVFYKEKNDNVDPWLHRFILFCTLLGFSFLKLLFLLCLRDFWSCS